MTQTKDVRVIAEAWDTLQPFLPLDKCVGCECIQAALTELVMTLEALPAGPEQERLLSAIRGALDLESLHACLGCEPCEPADVLIQFYKAQDAAATADRCVCGPSCPDGPSAP